MAVSLPVTVAAAFFVEDAAGYVFVLVVMASGAYTTPALAVGWYTMRRAPAGDRLAAACFYGGLVTVYAIGVGMLVGLASDWRWGNVAAVPAVVLSGVLHCVGLTLLVRSRSGRRALSVDLIEAVGAVVALVAPMVVLWGPAVVEAEASWFAVPTAAILPFMLWGVYWSAMLRVRLGPGPGAFETCSLAMALTGTLNVVLQTAQGVSGFALPAPPLVALHGLCISMCLLVPLNIPNPFRPGLNRLPPLAQVRDTRFATLITLSGVLLLLASTAVVAKDRPWAVPFALGVVSVLLVLAGLRHMATVGETRRLYRQVEEASEERRHLVDRLVDRSVHDQQDFAGHLYEQAVSAYVSFRTLVGAGRLPAVGPSAVAEATEAVGGDLARQAESVRGLMLALRAAGGRRYERQGLSTPIAAYFSTLYGDHPAPQLAVAVADDLALDWIAEAVLLQIGREALHNVRRHSEASNVEVTVTIDDGAPVLRICDDGIGFDPDSVVEGSGMATMRASAAVLDGTLAVDTGPGEGTRLTVKVGVAPGPAEPPGAGPPDAADRPTLRAVPDRVD